jgi:uncharacterized protein YneF (UPF0154 family)
MTTKEMWIIAIGIPIGLSVGFIIGQWLAKQLHEIGKELKRSWKV